MELQQRAFAVPDLSAKSCYNFYLDEAITKLVPWLGEGLSKVEAPLMAGLLLSPTQLNCKCYKMMAVFFHVRLPAGMKKARREIAGLYGGILWSYSKGHLPFLI